ncbi:MAG: hypothetical protein JXQ73_24155 [Phycisphaerae bacterium]|nr:hypothetical protein [Phycisphaerae bacterium]
MSKARVCHALIVSLFVCSMLEASTLERDRDPVVLLGSSLPWLTGVGVGNIVAFRYDGGWQQIPVQIDERKVVDYSQVNLDPNCAGHTTTAYVDPNTYTGADTDPTFDADDELVFMAKDAGDEAGPGAGEPAGVIAGTGLLLTITDPLDSATGYVYLYRTDGTLNPDAGQDYVSYAFNLLAGAYIPNYNTGHGPNPENSQAFSAYYRTHFSDRWICDEINVYAGGATGVDILDRHKNLYAPGGCERTEDTFSNGEGAFFVNKDGPVRALRSYLGANSGPLTQRVHRFYEQCQDVATHLRVHIIPGMMDLYDYSPAASGMTHYDNINTSGLLIDGVPDTYTYGVPQWELVTGAQGSLAISSGIDTDLLINYVINYYSDDSTPSTTQCTGDAYEYGTSGFWIGQFILNTDPLMGPYYYLTARRTLYYEPPGATVALAALRHDQASTPLEVTTTPYEPTCLLSLTVVNGLWGTVQLDPAPADPNAPEYALGTPVTLTAQPNEGRSFNEWLIFDPNYPGDANYAAADGNLAIQVVLDTNREVQAAFKCGTGLSPFLGMALLTLAVTLIRRRG